LPEFYNNWLLYLHIPWLNKIKANYHDEIMDQIQPYLDYFAQHPSWAIAVIFLIAFGEALLVIGLVVPSTAVLVGAGALVGTGKLDFWEVMIATTLGCVLGDQVSYWAGRIFGDRLRTIWPLSAYPHLVAKGEDFIKVHGGKSIALGRFVPGVKAVVPGIAGMFGMNQFFFTAVNISSGIVWAMVHLGPGILLGQALALAGDLSGRLLTILLVLLVVLAVAGWLIRLAAGFIGPYRKATQGHLANWARRSGRKPLRRFAEAIAPENPRSVLLILLLMLSVLAIITLIDIVSGRVLGDVVGNFDQSLNNLFSEVRNAPGDELFIRITMLGDNTVTFGTTVVMVLWLMWQRAWRAAGVTAAAVAIAKIIAIIASIRFGMHAPLSTDALVDFQQYRFPNSHTLMVGTVFGVLATLCSRGLGRWSNALVVASCGIVVIAVGFSRLYLGVNWLTDVSAGLLAAFIVVTIYSVVLAALPVTKFRPIGLLIATTCAFVLVGVLHSSIGYDRAERHYRAPNKVMVYALSTWSQEGWSKVSSRRIDMAGVPAEPFAVQWLGSSAALQAALLAADFKSVPKWTWRDSFFYINPNADLASTPPRPALHEGLKAKITASQPVDQAGHFRLTARAYRANAVASGEEQSAVFLISLTHEVLKPHFQLIAVPFDQVASQAETKAFIAKLLAETNIEKIDEKQVNGMPLVILKPKS
jgi:membrane protein DedA with SNARE-associated domain/membrane-associated phospholipid phosphatase